MRLYIHQRITLLKLIELCKRKREKRMKDGKELKFQFKDFRKEIRTVDFEEGLTA